jgi:hypothetical protein
MTRSAPLRLGGLCVFNAFWLRLSRAVSLRFFLMDFGD